MNKNILNLLLLSTASISSMGHTSSRKNAQYRNSEIANTSNTSNTSNVANTPNNTSNNQSNNTTNASNNSPSNPDDSSNYNNPSDMNSDSDDAYDMDSNSMPNTSSNMDSNSMPNNSSNMSSNSTYNNTSDTCPNSSNTCIPYMNASTMNPNTPYMNPYMNSNTTPAPTNAVSNPPTFNENPSEGNTTTSATAIPMGPIFNEKVDALLPNNLMPRFVLPPLAYDYNALEPYIDEASLRIHHNRHHQNYVNNLNTAISRYPDIYAYNLGQMLTYTDRLPIDIQAAVINNSGGHYNHSFYWNLMSPDGGGTPTGAIGDEIDRQFGSFSNFKRAFTAAALSVFGSGYAWLVLTPGGRLEIITTRNQDTPLALNVLPLLAIDVWEHAHYLKHQNQRDRHIEDFFNVINWPYVNELYEAATDSGYIQ